MRSTEAARRAGRVDRPSWDAATGLTNEAQRLPYGLPLKLAQDLVSALDGAVQRVLGWLLTDKRRLDLLRPEVAQLHHVAEAQTPRVLRRLLAGQLDERDLERGVFLVEARRLGFLISRPRDREIARFLMQTRLPVGVGQEGEEARDALVLVRLLAAHHPKACPADDRVLRRAGHVGIVRHWGGRPIELRIPLHVCVEAR